MSKKLNPTKTGVDFQQVVRPAPCTGRNVVIINSVELNILIGRRKMKRALVIRLLALEIAPLLLGLALLYFYPRLLAPVFAAASIPIFICVCLSVRDGAVLERGGTVCEKKEGAWFWAWISIHASLGLFLLAGAFLVFLRP
jgi:hypothetical protein